MMLIDTLTLKETLDLLKDGECVAIPTETVYGLAADATNSQSIAKIYSLKGRPSFNPLIVHVSSLDQISKFAVLTPLALTLGKSFWPGPLTLVLPLQTGHEISPLVTAGLNTIAVRIPSHPLTLELLHQFEKPLAAPSANRSTEVSPVHASMVVESLGQKVPILDGGPCQVGLESTILDLSTHTPTLLRPGGIEVELLQEIIPHLIVGFIGDAIKAPGMMKRHYAPKTPVVLNRLCKNPGEGFLGFGDDHGLSDLNLSSSGDLGEAAHNLFSMLSEMDKKGFSRINVAPIPDHGLGLAINDRLKRASTLA